MDEDRRRRINLLILRRRRIRYLNNPFDMTVTAFKASYRLTPNITLRLIHIIRPHVPVTVSPLAVSLEIRFLGVPHFYATGSYQRPTGKSIDVAVAQPTLSIWIKEITLILNLPEFVRRFIKFPSNDEQIWDCIERNHMLGARIPNTLAYIDSTLIKMMKPSLENNRAAFIGRKSFASMNVLVTCDRRMLYIFYIFLNVLARYAGATNDSLIYHHSALRRRVRGIYQMPDAPRCFLIGDSGFPLEPWLMTPFARGEEPEDDSPEGRFNRDLCSDRSIVERAIGLWEARFRAVNGERVLRYSPPKMCMISVATAILHNICILYNVPNYMDNYREGVNIDVNHDINEAQVLDYGRKVRAQLVNILEAERAH